MKEIYTISEGNGSADSSGLEGTRGEESWTDV